MGTEDAIRSAETQAALDRAQEQIAANEADEANRRAVEAAKRQMKSVLQGEGLRLADEKMTLDDAFAQIQQQMKERFSQRLNTKEQNEHLAALQQGNRIYETFELIPGETDEDGNPVPNGRPPFTIRFQSINTDENAFINNVALLNGQAIRNGTETIPRYDETMRLERLLVFSTVAVGSKTFDPISIEDIYDVEDESDANDRFSKLNAKLVEINSRLGEIRRSLIFGTYSTAISALGIWIEYQQELASPMRIANFSTPPSERS